MLNPIQDLYSLVEEKYSSESNAEITLKVLSCLCYIENNFEGIIKTCSQPNRPSILRADNHMSFHIGHIKSGKEARIYFSNLLQQMREVSKFLSEENNPIYIKLFLQNIRQSEIGCMEARLKFALLFVGMLRSNRGIIPLDNFMEDFYRKLTNRLQEITVFKTALDYFTRYINVQYPVSINGKVISLNWQLIKRYLEEVLCYDIGKWQWKKMESSPYNRQRNEKSL